MSLGVNRSYPCRATDCTHAKFHIDRLVFETFNIVSACIVIQDTICGVNTAGIWRSLTKHLYSNLLTEV